MSLRTSCTLARIHESPHLGVPSPCLSAIPRIILQQGPKIKNFMGVWGTSPLQPICPFICTPTAQNSKQLPEPSQQEDWRLEIFQSLATAARGSPFESLRADKSPTSFKVPATSFAQPKEVTVTVNHPGSCLPACLGPSEVMATLP